MKLQFTILRAAACLVPAEARAEWLAEWSAELCYVRDRRRQSGTGFCLGAFRDAFWLRRNHPAPQTRSLLRLNSPVHCLLFLAILAVATSLLAFRLPGPRDLILPWPYRDTSRLVMITPARRFSAFPQIPKDAYRALASRTRHQFTDMAFYRPIPARVGTAGLSVALSNANLFNLLGAPVPTGGTLLLSENAWRRHFATDPHVVGRILDVDGRRVVIAGVIPATSWRLPGRIDAWLLDDEVVRALPQDAKGFVVGRRLRPQHDWQLRFPVSNDREGYTLYESTALNRPQPILAIVTMIAIALLILPAVTSLALGEYPANRDARRWVFLVVKIALILPIVFFGTLDIGSLIALQLQPHIWLIGYVAAFRWALIDQRRRCPVCLRVLAHPTRIGRPSQVFLEWYGTEFICIRGHGLLHVPEIPTSSYSTQRWLQLDQSWSGLFP